MSNNDLEKAMQPQQKKKGPLFFIVIGLLGIFLIAGGYWVVQQIMVKGAVEIPLPKEVADKVNESLRLEDGKIGPVRITSDGGQNAQGSQLDTTGVQPGQQWDRPATSGLIAPPSQSATALMEEQLRNEVAGQPRQKIYDGADAVVTTGFVSDFAQYLANGYWPRGTHVSAKNGPSSSSTIAAAGQRYGLELTGFASTRPEAQRDYLRDRSLVLNYAYTPSMLTALTRLYADRFADHLAQAGFEQSRTLGGKEVNLSDAEVAQMLRFYADYSWGVGGALASYNGNAEAERIVHAYTLAQAEAFESNSRFHEAQYQMDNARTEQNSRQLREAIQAVKAAEQDYRKAMLEQERAKEAVVTMMSKGDSRRLDAQSLLYIATWAARRGPNAGPANQSAAAAAEFLAQVLDEKASEISGN